MRGRSPERKRSLLPPSFASPVEKSVVDPSGCTAAGISSVGTIDHDRGVGASVPPGNRVSVRAVLVPAPNPALRHVEQGGITAGRTGGIHSGGSIASAGSVGSGAAAAARSHRSRYQRNCSRAPIFSIISFASFGIRADDPRRGGDHSSPPTETPRMAMTCESSSQRDIRR